MLINENMGDDNSIDRDQVGDELGKHYGIDTDRFDIWTMAMTVDDINEYLRGNKKWNDMIMNARVLLDIIKDMKGVK